MKHALYDCFIREKIVAILRGLAPENAAACGDALFRSGVRLMEVPLNRPGALESIRLLARQFSGTGVHVGAGTVLAPEQAEQVRDAGGAGCAPCRDPQNERTGIAFHAGICDSDGGV